ncbi:MAG: hypothetical protein IBJ03_13455 [Gemmatimonadaceae bacterium]|nr:hypothetical protein [Gemmatimonadaceae bacterium]
MNALSASLPIVALVTAVTVTLFAAALWRRSWPMWLLAYASAVTTLLVAWP